MLNNKSLQAFLAIGPMIAFILLIAGYFVFFFSIVTNIEQLENNPGNGFPAAFLGGFAFFFVMIVIVSLISLLSLIYFVIHAAKNPNLEEGNIRVVWILILVLISGIGQFIYWLVEIRMKNPKPVIPN